MLVNAREWRNNASWSGVAYTTFGSKARSNARWRGRSLAFKTRWRMCFSYKSFTFICFYANFSSFSFVDRQNTYSCKSDLFANLKKIQCSLYFSMHSEWRYSLVFTSVSSRRRCWSLDLAGVCLFVMSSYTPPFFFFFFSFSFPMIIFPVLGWEWW